MSSNDTLARLAAVIESRRSGDADKSYVARLSAKGLDGGGDGEAGKTEVRRANGTVETLKACDQTVLEAGDAVIVTTPTPGGFGRG